MPAATIAAIAALTFSVPAALANDSEAEWALGGLVLKENRHISMEHEDLYISADEVRVDYTYFNRSDVPQTILVSFPLPSIPAELSDWYAGQNAPDFDYLDFATTVDGKPVQWETIDRAMLDGRDVTAQLNKASFPLHWYNDDSFLATLHALPADQARQLLDQGLIEEDPGGWTYLPRWQVQRHITRQQIFPAQSAVHVSHRYVPVIGGSVGGMLYPAARSGAPEALAEYRQKWCVDDDFLAAFDRRNQRELARKQGDPAPYGESWLGYVLSSGANWAGPIKSFRLVVDKGAPDNLVSFCMDGVTKIGPTQFEVRKQNYEPRQDLNILIVQWYDQANLE